MIYFGNIDSHFDFAKNLPFLEDILSLSVEISNVRSK